MERRHFFKSSLIGTTALSLGTDVFAQPMDNNPLLPFMTNPSNPEDKGIGNGVNFVRTIVRQNQMDNHFSAVEVYVESRRIGPPIHHHKELDELMYVTEGTAGVMIEDEVFIVEKGSFLLRPHGLVHTFFNPSDKPLRFIDIFPNQNFEDYLEDMFINIGKKLVTKNLQPGSTEFTNEFRKMLGALDERFGVTYFPGDKRFIELTKKYKLT
jgi:mannose-6-phosphate isomerase-like protein (cupin superfamily)